MDAVDFVVDRSDLRRTACLAGRHTGEMPLVPGQVLVRVDRFAFTANNVTYGAVGDLIGYWSFFPADPPWGRIPVWGFGDVVRSEHAGVPVGERLFGYFPMSTYLALQPEQVTPATLVDATPHRAALPPIYNQYTRVAADPGWDRAREGEIALFRPLFATAFLLDDWLARESFFGARTVVMTSASSKTALALAFLLAKNRRERCTVTALTSARNAAFVRATAYYDTVLTYDETASLRGSPPAVLVDFAGNAPLLRTVHAELAAALMYSCQVGVTHWDRLGSTEGLSGPAPVLFFAPDHMRDRLAEWGAPEYLGRIGGAMQQFLGSARGWLRIVDGRGRAALESVYHAMLDGRIDPAEGHVLSL